jgi:RNA 3'-terminal phosphate cyclase (ATP)
LTYRPQTRPQAGRYTFDVTEAAAGGSAGSMTLVFQTLFLPLAFAGAESQLVLKGGTHVAWSPHFDYLTDVYLPTLKPTGLDAVCSLDAWGFYPVGGGQFTAIVKPVTVLPLKPLSMMERGALRQSSGAAVAAKLRSHIPQRITNRAVNVLREAGLPVNIQPQRVGGVGPGVGLFLLAEYEQAWAGFAALGKKGKPSSEVADEACQDFLDHHHRGAAVDPHLADQLLLPLALAQGQSQFTTSQVTQHLLTNAQIISRFIPAQIEIIGDEGQVGRILVQGVGFRLP